MKEPEKPKTVEMERRRGHSQTTLQTCDYLWSVKAEQVIDYYNLFVFSTLIIKYQCSTINYQGGVCLGVIKY